MGHPVLDGNSGHVWRKAVLFDAYCKITALDHGFSRSN